MIKIFKHNNKNIVVENTSIAVSMANYFLQHTGFGVRGYWVYTHIVYF